MDESSDDRLAPVSYLPWAAPRDEHPAGAGRRADERAAARSHDDASSGDPTTLETASRAATTDVAEADARRSRRAPALSLVSDDDDDGDDDEGVETGAERDARIDRLVVSRLRRSALSVAEVQAVLAEHGLDEGEIGEWIERYERLGYLDDSRLAEQLTHSHGTRRGRGSSAIRHELERRGIRGEVARSAVDGLDPDVELVNATAVAERRARQLRGLDRVTAERRLMAFLLRRGYPSSIVREAVRAALAADGS